MTTTVKSLGERVREARLLATLSRVLTDETALVHKVEVPGSKGTRNCVLLDPCVAPQVPGHLVIKCTCGKCEGKTAGTSDDGQCFGNHSSICRHVMAALMLKWDVVGFRNEEAAARKVAKRAGGTAVVIKSSQGKQREMWMIFK